MSELRSTLGYQHDILRVDASRDGNDVSRRGRRRLTGKQVIGVLGAVTAIGVLAGCGSSGDNPPTSNAGFASASAEAAPSTQTSTENKLPEFIEAKPLNCDAPSPVNQSTFVFRPAQGDFEGEIELITGQGKSLGRADMFYNQVAGVFRPGIYSPHSGELPDTDTPDSGTKYGGNMIGNEPSTITRNLPPTDGPLRSITLQITTPENAGNIQPGATLQEVAVRASCTTN